MPTYEYACTSCAHQWEIEQSMRDEPIKECANCHAQTARRQISRGTGFILKGGGWYADLYSSSGNKPPASSSSSSSSKPSSSSSGDGISRGVVGIAVLTLLGGGFALYANSRPVGSTA